MTKKLCKYCSHLHIFYILPTSKQYCDIMKDYVEPEHCCKEWEFSQENYDTYHQHDEVI